jgi:hypothetical protein
MSESVSEKEAVSPPGLPVPAADRLQRRFWQELTSLKAHCCYISYYRYHTERTDNVLNMVLAVSSSASIGTWVLWQEYSKVWAAIIAASQVINAIKPFLNYRKRLDSLNGLAREIDGIFFKAEMTWHRISEGQLTNDQIQNEWIALKESISKAEHKHFADATLPQRPVAVGTRLTPRPPPRSERALLTHSALALDV